MKEQFTQGEWEASKVRYRKAGKDWVDFCWSVGVGGFSIVGEVNGGGTLDMKLGQMSEVCKANAHLIAAAPKMYRMLKEFLPMDEDGNGEFSYNEGSEYLGDEVTKILAEARGEKSDSD
jgi:hypothetical protein